MRIIDGNIFEGMRMIIPEHREAMVEQGRQQKRVERPILDQDKLEEMSRLLAEAILNPFAIKVSLYKPFGIETIHITPIKIDQHTRMLKGMDEDGESISILFADILDVSI